MILSRTLRRPPSYTLVRPLLLPGGTCQREMHRPASPRDTRNRLVSARLEDVDEDMSHKNKNWKSIAGGCMSLSGCMLLGYSHFDMIFTPDTVGLSLLAIGAVSAVLTSKHPIAEKLNLKNKGKQPSKFTFKVINDATLFSSERKLLSETVPIGDIEIWPKDIQRKLEAYRKEDEKRVRGELSSRKEVMSAMMAADGERQPFTSERDALSALAPRAFILDYECPMIGAKQGPGRKDHRSRAELLGEEVSMLLACASSHDVVVVNLTSPGGSVIEYGLAASHLMRLKKAGLRSIVTVDKVAASGGFMMACCADEIVAAPFAYLGSIGVIAEVPNFHRLLNKHEVDHFMFTAGKFKRTVSFFNEVSAEGKEKFQEQLESIHTAFKQHVSEQRGAVMDVDKVATGEAWLALQCKEYGLVDRLGTSWDVMHELAESGYDVIKVERQVKKRGFLGSLRDSGAAFGSAVSEEIANTVKSVLSQVYPGGLRGDAGDVAKDVYDVAALKAPPSSVSSTARL